MNEESTALAYLNVMNKNLDNPDELWEGALNRKARRALAALKRKKVENDD